MTTWTADPSGGRDRGFRALVRAWVEVLVRPGRFFRTGVAPGDQAPGLVFGVAVALAYLGTLLGSGAARIPPDAPVIGGAGSLTVVVVALLVAVAVAPATLHLVAALQTVVLAVLVPDRAGVSETVQLIAYATAPCALAGLPAPALRAACAGYGAVLLAVGIVEVHGTSPLRAALAGALPAAVLFGYGFRGFAALGALGVPVPSG